MKWLLVLALLGLAVPAHAATVCVILENNIVTSQVPCGESTNPPSVEIDTTDSRWVAALLANARRNKQELLDIQFQTRFDLIKFIQQGTATNVTGTQVGNFLASTTNNYRSLKASIATAATPAAVNAIDITAGWPANP